MSACWLSHNKIHRLASTTKQFHRAVTLGACLMDAERLALLVEAGLVAIELDVNRSILDIWIETFRRTKQTLMRFEAIKGSIVPCEQAANLVTTCADCLAVGMASGSHRIAQEVVALGRLWSTTVYLPPSSLVPVPAHSDVVYIGLIVIALRSALVIVMTAGLLIGTAAVCGRYSDWRVIVYKRISSLVRCSFDLIPNAH